MRLLFNFLKKEEKKKRKSENPTPQTGSLDTFCLDSWQTAGCRSRTQNNYLLACYFIWLPKSGLFYTEPWKNTLHLLKENNTPLETLYNIPQIQRNSAKIYCKCATGKISLTSTTPTMYYFIPGNTKVDFKITVVQLTRIKKDLTMLLAFLTSGCPPSELMAA